jgi:Protein of unknown function (DUF3108)
VINSQQSDAFFRKSCKKPELSSRVVQRKKLKYFDLSWWPTSSSVLEASVIAPLVFSFPMLARSSIALILFVCFNTSRADESPVWAHTLTSNKGPGTFATLADINLGYEFGWSGIQAAKADVRFYSPDRGTLEIEAKGATSGLARTLFKLDVYQRAQENRTTLRPIQFMQEEHYRSETIKTNVTFSPNSVTGIREKIPADNPPKTTVFKFGPVFDLSTALLWIRSQPLRDGDTEQLVVWASNAPYLATVRVVGREVLKVKGEEKNAIKLDLKLKGITKSMELKEHKLFKSGRGWLSDDNDRLPLRLEADIFIGYVYAELDSVRKKQD